MIAVSIVVPVYNAQAWLPRFFASVEKQSLINFEVLMIDDASTDESAVLIAQKAACDSRFKLISLETNMGAGKARNEGILKAQGETLCFADPDDLLPENSLAVRYAAYKKHNAIVRACHDEIDEDGTLRNHEVPPEKLPDVFSPVSEAHRVGVDVFLRAHWTWLFPTKLLRRFRLFNGEAMRTAEDIVFLNKLFFHITRMVWIPDTVYYWMKRNDSLSTTKYTAEHYNNYFQCCDIFYEEAIANRLVELADDFFDNYLALYPGHLLGQAAEGKSSEAEAGEVLSFIAVVAERHKVIERCLPVLQRKPAHHAGIFRLLTLLKSKSPSPLLRLVESQQAFNSLMQESQFENIRIHGWSQEVSFDKFDACTNMFRVRYLFCDTPQREVYSCNNVPIQPAYSKNRRVHDGHEYSIRERLLWYPLPQEAESLLQLEIGGHNVGLNHTVEQFKKHFAPRVLNDLHLPPEVRALRHLARSDLFQTKYKNAWLFLDRDSEADDNAEHLYRWVMLNHPEINAWFVLNKDSHDWARLEAEGFRLVPHGSKEHHVLFLLSEKLISSHMDDYVFRPLEERYFSDFPKPQYTCLQHGVTKDDISNWLNNRPFDLFVTVTNAEYNSFVRNETPYELTEKEVILTGFPRYDKLLEPIEPENVLLVMPTWRTDLVGAWDGKGQRRDFNPNFFESSYVKTWKDVFTDARMASLCATYQYKVVFFAHPCFEDYLDGMPFPDFVSKLSKRECSLQRMMQKSKIMVTDFSSVAFDMAYMRRPVVYYQTEGKNDYASAQKWNDGFFDYDAMGFGPVSRDGDALFAHLERAMQADGVTPSPYSERIEKTFAYLDGGCCQRVFDKILLHGHETSFCKEDS